MANTNHRIFISYARKDGESFAKAICAEFDSLGLTYWRDRNQMEGGKSWWQQIQTNIEKADFLVLLATKHAMESATVKREWQIAREKGVCVYPVIVPTGDMPHPQWLPDHVPLPDEPLDFSKLPRWMSKLHFYNLAQEWETFIHYLQSPCNKSKVPFVTYELDRDKYVKRSEILEKAIQSFFEDGKRQIAQVNNHAISISLLGAGGFGKSTLATAICHNENIKSAFIDGIVWVTLGEKPDILAALRKINSAIDPNAADFIDIEQGVLAVARLLQDRDCLIVLDDVWNQEHLRYFMQGGRYCSRLITTRILDVATQVDRHILVDEMTKDESAQLLTAKLEGGNQGKIRDITRRLGEWPLLLDIANGILRKRASQSSIDEALHYLIHRLEQSGVGSIRSRDADKRKQSIDGALEVSLDQLLPDEKEAFIQLGIFPGDTDIPLSTLGALWGRDPFTTEDLVLSFNDFSLLSWDSKTKTIRLHDVVREYLASRIPEGQELHRRLIESWDDPYQLPNNYAWKWFSYHLSKAHDLERLHNLLTDSHWLDAKLRATDVAALLHDFEYADPQRESIHLIRTTLMLSAHVLAKDPGQLDHQLRGRLLRSNNPEVQALISKPVNPIGLKLISGSFPQPGGTLQYTFAGHTNRVRAVAISPDGNFVVSGSQDNTIRIWRMEDGTEKAVLHGHLSPVVAVCFDAASHLWSVDETGEIIKWDLDLNETNRRLTLNQKGINSVSLSTDGQTGASVADDLSLQVWNTETGEVILRTLVHSQNVTGVAFISGRDRAITTSHDNSLGVWDVHSGKRIFSLVEHTDVVEAVAVNPQGSLAVSGSRDRTIKLWDLETGKCLRTFRGHRDRISSLAFSPDGHSFASASHDWTLRIWDITGERERVVLEGHTHRISSVVYSPDGKRLISGSWDKTLKVWDLTSDAVGHQLHGHLQEVTDLVATPDSRHMLSASEDRTVRVWDCASGRITKTLEGFADRISALASVDADVFVAAVGSPYSFRPAELQRWRLPAGQFDALLGEHDEAIQAVAVGSDGETLISTARDCRLSVWNLKDSIQVCLLGEQLLDAQHILLTRDCQRAFTASWNTVQSWNLETRSLEFEIPAHQGMVTSLCLTPDEKEIITTGSDGNICIWQSEDGTSKGIFADGITGLRDLVITPNGRWIITVSQDALLRLWEMSTGNLHSQFYAESALLHCALTPDGRTVAVAERSGRIHFLNLGELE